MRSERLTTNRRTLSGRTKEFSFAANKRSYPQAQSGKIRRVSAAAVTAGLVYEDFADSGRLNENLSGW
jgi:hypothetical protein